MSLGSRGHKDVILAVLSGILLALPFWNGQLWIFSWFGFVPLFSALRNKPRLRSFILSCLCGTAFWSITIYWLIHVTLLGQILLILYLVLYFGFFGLLISSVLKTQDPRRLILIPSLWVIFEYLRSHLLTGFGWALLGYSQYLNLPIIQVADIFGAYGVSFLVMVVNITIYRLLGIRAPEHQSTKKEIKCDFVVLMCVFVVLGYGYFRLYDLRPTTHDPRPTLGISVIQGNIPQELKWAAGSEGFILDRYLRLTGEVARDNPDLIIWPEASMPGFLGDDDWMFTPVLEKAGKIKIPLLVGSVVRENKRYFNSALLIDGRGVIASRYDKLHLVPFGEYIPLKNTFKFLETIVPIGDFTAGKEYTIFSITARRLPDEQAGKTQDLGRFAVLICFEDTIPELSRNFVNRGAAFLVNITNDGWFRQTSAPYQHLAASVFRAVENRVPLARAANTGISCFIDAKGRITDGISQEGRDIFVSGIKTGNIKIAALDSLYRSIGDVFVLVCLALAGFCGIIVNSKVRSEKFLSAHQSGKVKT